MEFFEKVIDLLFYHLYVLQNSDNDFAKTGRACHLMLFALLLPSYISLGSLATLIMPKKFAALVAIILVIVLMMIYIEFQARYEDYKTRKMVLDRFKPKSRIKSISIILLYCLVALSPTLLIIFFYEL